MKSIGFFFFLWLLHNSIGGGAGDTGVCDTPECIRYADEILSSLDTSVDPCDDFYSFSCGGWARTHEIPEDTSSYNIFHRLGEKVKDTMKGALEAEESEDDPDTVTSAKLFYKSCKDEDAIEALGTAPLLTYLNEQYGGWPLLETDVPQPPTSYDYMSKLSVLEKDGLDPLFVIFVMTDPGNSSRNVLFFDQVRLPLGSRNFYLKGRQEEVLAAYETYATEIALELGANRETVSGDVSDMIDFEISLANITAPPEERIDPEQKYNLMTLKEMSERFPWFDWLSYITELFPSINPPITDNEEVVVWEPSFFHKLGSLLNETSDRVVYNYMMWRVIQRYMDAMPERLRTHADDFNRVSYGTEARTARWKTCFDKTSSALPFVVGRMFVEVAYDAESREDNRQQMEYLMEAFRQRLQVLRWMDEETKIKALHKLEAMSVKIGYPDMVFNTTYLDLMYPVKFQRSRYFSNELAAKRQRTARHLSILRTPPSEREWYLPPSTVNAYYSPTKNEIVFLAAILQPPVYRKDAPHYLNYGATVGSPMGHEITHGFDNTGRKFDLHGNLVQWWDDRVIESFKNQSACFINQYNSFHYPELNQTVNGLTTLGENIADCGAMQEGYLAYQNFISENGEDPLLPGLNFTQNQLYFISIAQLWCAKKRVQALRKQLLSDLHSPGRYRVIGPCQNSPHFAEAFQCPAGSYMNPVNKCLLW